MPLEEAPPPRAAQDRDGAMDSAHDDTGGTSETAARFNEPVRGNLVMLPSALDPLGRKIRRITTDVVDDDEQLVLVKRRARAAKAAALRPNRTAHGECGLFDAISVHSFEYLKVIGVGGMGRVLLARHRGDGNLYALKVVSKRSVQEEELLDKVLSERDVLGGTQHHSLVHLHCAFQTRSRLVLVMEYCPGGELARHLQEAGKFAEDVAAFFAAEVALALEHLHRHGIVYRDLKPENILLTADGHVKLVDFGLSKFGITEATRGAHSMCGSYEYLAPEIGDRDGYGTAVDWWSFGCILYEMLTGLPPWYDEDVDVMQENVRAVPLSMPDDISEDAIDLLRGLLSIDPTQRIGSHEGSVEVKQHPFFRHIDWQMLTFGELRPPIQPCASASTIEDATNFDDEFTRLSVGSVDSASSSSDSDAYDEFQGFDYVAPTAVHIEYGYARDVGAPAR